MFAKIERTERDGVTETVPVDGMGASQWEKYLDPRPREAIVRERIARDMEAMDLDTLNVLDCVVHTLRTGDTMPRTAVLAAADAWYSTQGGTEEVERLRAAVVAMRGEK